MFLFVDIAIVVDFAFLFATDDLTDMVASYDDAIGDILSTLDCSIVKFFLCRPREIVFNF